ncbi:MAG: bifunctional DNA-formamidopyrimidine glycosylase/DNA-(apurinic or apyrimidinic site) lyase [Pseudomonadota bacterium]|nr:bifunctional DNA-formamidopyrimidine glycosylase/DNA-(apurinic or apyrimidinic site) lyase [Burkholderiaceae bacterium]MDQ3447107.1 bifunctional DNA-formamidopyrimidine glycosylase/DNA-(apurinic or apyrimidinic site) lyase [Pseudomonadota bacterium]
MPELPEVEVTRRALAPYVEQKTVESVIVRDRRLRWPVPPRLSALLAGRTVERLRRRGKYLLWEFVHGTLISHLGMSGAWRVWPRRRAVPPPGTHDHVDILFIAACVRLTDPRRFGALLWHDARKGDVTQHPLLAGLGIEPFDARFGGAWLYRHTRTRGASIKQVLLGGDVVVGVGNIYASESLFRARISPKRSARRIGLVRYEALATAVREVLTEAIAVGGSTLRDFVGADGADGYFMLDARVYDRAGEPCRVCATPIVRVVQGQRATFYCRVCQKR